MRSLLAIIFFTLTSIYLSQQISLPLNDSDQLQSASIKLASAELDDNFKKDEINNERVRLSVLFTLTEE